MFVEQRIALAVRKERLIARSETQRAAIVASLHALEKPLGMLDRGATAVAGLRGHPVLVGAGVAALVVLGRRSLFRWAGRGIMAWRAWRSVSGWARRYFA